MARAFGHPFLPQNSRLELFSLNSREGRLATDLFVKQTDTHQYLHFKSCHPFHIKKAIPYGQALRMRRIRSDVHVFDQRCKELKEWLLSRKYDPKLIDKQIARARAMDREQLLTYKDPSKNGDDKGNRDILTLSYHPALNGTVQKIITDNFNILGCDEEHRNVYQQKPMVAFRRAKTLKDKLVRARLPQYTVSTKKGCAPCAKRRNCDVCHYIASSTTFSTYDKSRTFDIRCGLLHCNSKYVVYLLQCKTCNIQYVGSTTTQFRKRFNNYKSQFRKFSNQKEGNKTSVPQSGLFEHFMKSDHNGMSDWAFKLIDEAETESDLRLKESWWQYKLDTFKPKGLNERDVAIT